MIDVVASARYFEGRGPEWLVTLEHAIDIGN